MNCATNSRKNRLIPYWRLVEARTVLERGYKYADILLKFTRFFAGLRLTWILRIGTLLTAKTISGDQYDATRIHRLGDLWLTKFFALLQ